MERNLWCGSHVYNETLMASIIAEYGLQKLKMGSGLVPNLPKPQRSRAQLGIHEGLCDIA